MKKLLVVANWKMFIESPLVAAHAAAALRRKTRSFAGVEAWLAPAYPLIPTVAQVLKNSAVKTGAQAVSSYDSFDPTQNKAHTGEVSAVMLKEAGAAFAIVGHSERRALGETDETIQGEIARVTEAGLTALLCVGERERSSTTLGASNRGDYFSVVEEQLISALQGILKLKKIKLVVAYEPVWAIGKTAADAMKPGDLQEMVIFIRKTLADVLGREAAERVPILYGGSVESENAARLIREGGIAGFLVGHASADPESFLEILKSVRPSLR